MTNADAMKEAVRRWGYQARAEVKFDCGAEYIVSSRYWNHYGVGPSWDAAFRNAEQRDSENKPR